MRTESGLRPRIEFLVASLAIAAQIAILHGSPYPIAQPWDTLWHFIAYAALTLMLWIATSGRRPWLVPGAAMLLGAATGNLAVAAPAAIVTAGALSVLELGRA